MADFLAPTLPPDAVASEEFLYTLLEVALTGFALFRPVYDAAGGAIIDLSYEYLNPAAQQMLRLPPRPSTLFLTRYPAAELTGIFAFYRDAFLSGQTQQHQGYFQHDDLDGYFHLAARRQGQLLVVSFTDAHDQPRTAGEEELRPSQAREWVPEPTQQVAAISHNLQAATTACLPLSSPLADAQQHLRHLNKELEARVAQRTHDLQAARQEAEYQREQARVHQGLLGQILGQVPAAIATLAGPEHRYSFFNTPYQVLSAGRTRLGHTVAQVFPEVEEQGFIQLLDQVYTTGQPFIGTDTPAMLHDQTTGQPELRYVDFIYQPLFDGQQRTQGILAFILDVTDRVRARKQADTLQAAMLAVAKRQAQQRQDLYQIFEQAPTAMLLLRGPEHRIEYLNPAYARFFPGQSLLGHPMAEAHPAATKDGIVALLDHVYQTGEMYRGHELPFELGDDQPDKLRYFNFIYQAYREHGQTVGVSVFATEATEQVLARRAAETQRSTQQEELQRVFEQAPVAICVFRGSTHVLEIVNLPMAAMLGRETSQLVGRPFSEALPELAAQDLPSLLDTVLQTGTPFIAQEQALRLGQHAAEIRHFNYVYQPLRDAAGASTGVVCVAAEVTDQVLARQRAQALNEELQATNQQLHATNERLTRTNADLDTFVYTASHDLKSPITNVEGLLLALRKHLPANAFANALVPQLLDMIGGAVGRFQQTLAHLTDISRLQHEQDQPTEAVDLATLVEGVRLDILPELAAAGATLTIDLPYCPTIQFSAKNLRSIIYNLLSNAAKYRAPDRPPLVQLRCRYRPGWVVLEVQDNGLGLSESQQGELFRMFRRLHTHTEGSGVGLYMVKKIIENAGGTITVQSVLGQGSTFTVSLPA